MKAPFQIRYQLITPQQAADWLANNNTRNRKLRQTTVNALAADMLAGEWIPNHHAIAFGESGVLLDGQHRLAAIVRSQVSIPSIVCEGVPEKPPGKKQSTMDTIDRGATRSIGDMLKLQHGIEKHEVFVAACASALLDIATHDTHARRGRLTLRTTLQILEIAGPQVRFLVENRPSVRGLNAAATLSAFAFAHHLDPKRAQLAIDMLITGANLTAGHPILYLRNHLLAKVSHISARERSDKMRSSNVTLAALHAWLNNLPLDRIEPKRVHNYATAMIDTWPELRAAGAAILKELNDPAPVYRPTIRPGSYADQLIRAAELSEKINRKLST